MFGLLIEKFHDARFMTMLLSAIAVGATVMGAGVTDVCG